MNLFIIILIIICICIIIFIYSKPSESFTNLNLFNDIGNPTNIYNLAPSQATSLGTYPINEKQGMDTMNKYPQDMLQRKWCSSWSNNSNKFYCFIDQHLNRKCWWGC